MKHEKTSDYYSSPRHCTTVLVASTLDCRTVVALQTHVTCPCFKDIECAGSGYRVAVMRVRVHQCRRCTNIFLIK